MIKIVRRYVTLMSACAITLPGCASAPARADAPRQSAPAAERAAESAPVPALTRAPGERPSDAEAAFLDGYRAYNNHDYRRAIDRLKFAADNFLPLGDYALYYLGLAERDQGDLNSAVDSFDRLVRSYPRSVMLDRAELQLAIIQLKLGRSAEASATASRLIARGPDASIEQNARLVEGKALIALGNPKAAYAQLMELRAAYPHADTDTEARNLCYALLAAKPELAQADSLAYHLSESELLLKEGDLPAAVKQAMAGLAMNPEPGIRAELTWIEARALKPEPEAAKRALLEYLRIAPRGPAAAPALETLALIYWHEDQFDPARATFERLIANFPASKLAPGAMLRIGRSFEEQKRFDDARADYRRLTARYPSSESAADARFRGPWTLYQARRYQQAAAGFEQARAHANQPSDRDMCDYWRARALEKLNQEAAARAIFAKVAQSIDTNYYPAMAALRVSAATPELPAASAPDPAFNGTPSVTGAAQFHLARLQTLRAMDLRELEPDELKALAQEGGNSSEMRRFVLAGFAKAGAWYDAIVVATRMEKHGQLGHDVAERVRYPRAYWDLVQSASNRLALDPYLVLALARQESLFNPRATSVSNARGLMQLIPSTARKVAAERGMSTVAVPLYDPTVNVDLGTTYLKSLFEMFNGDSFRAVAAYNAGEHAVQKWSANFAGDDDEWVENIAYKETREYVKKVIGGRREYQLLYQPNAAASGFRETPRSSG
ncbi:MAG: transglycosylase SLT domain-containing protein [Candidatus Binatus sp.]|uniref:transglycosylase SLT domain-containing protein n=1 Tax=Candidatus Binatus sp. TaxID=2811406 RepID=UPI002724EEF5|nr:transglycosylase SLT domain-containing protein [Candidatus Binatus sp.]MDO8434136.1 transglycosylase SLT domain-containing protein [Candidatus Binatus sp.]